MGKVQRISTFIFSRVLGTCLRWHCRAPESLRKEVRDYVAARTGGVRVAVHCPGNDEPAG